MFEHQKDGAICQHIVKISFPFGIEFDIVETHSRGRKVEPLLCVCGIAHCM